MSRSRKRPSRQRARAQKLRRTRLWMLVAFMTIAVAVVGAIALHDISSTRRTARATGSPDQVNRIGPAEAKELLDQGTAVIYDSRSAEAYHAKHVTGALSFPEAEQEALVGSLPVDKKLVFYCT